MTIMGSSTSSSDDDDSGVATPSGGDGGKGTTTRRDLLRVVGLTGAGLGVAAAVGVPLGRTLTRSSKPRSAVSVAGALRIDDVAVVDPRDGRIRSGLSVLVREGRIAAITEAGGRASEEGVLVIDGAGRFVVPGYN
ncbi:hypothetical protein QUV00_22555, partial [Xanthomonas citri pv. citri]